MIPRLTKRHIIPGSLQERRSSMQPPWWHKLWFRTGVKGGLAGGGGGGESGSDSRGLVDMLAD